MTLKKKFGAFMHQREFRFYGDGSYIVLALFLSGENLKQKIAKLISALNDTLVTSWPPI